MSEKGVEAVKRAIEATNRRDAEALVEELDPDVEWHPGIAALVDGGSTVYRGHAGALEYFRDLDEAFAETHFELSEIRDLGSRIFATGRFRARGEASGAETETPVALVVEEKNGKARRIQTYLDPEEALEAAGLEE